MKVKEIMSKDVVTAEVPGTIENVLDTFRNGKHSGLPVVKENTEEVVGVITRSDLLRNPEEDQIAMLMTRDPIVINSEGEVEEVARLLLNHDIRRLPVVDNGELLGLVSVADLVDVLSEKEIDGDISEYMEGSCTSTWEETPVPLVGEIMRLADRDAVPVLSDEGKLVGMVSDTDLVKAFKKEDDLGKSDMGAASDEDQWTWDGMRDTMKLYYDVSILKLPKYPVKEIMTTEIHSTYQGSSVIDAAKLMSNNEIEQLPVLDEDDNIIGLIKDRNLIKAFLK